MKTGGAQEAPRAYRMVARADAAQATAERVLDVALELFTDKPYEDVSLEEIAARADVAKRTVLQPRRSRSCRSTTGAGALRRRV